MPKFAHTGSHFLVCLLQAMFHSPQGCGVAMTQQACFAVESLPHAQGGMALVAHPAFKRGAADAEQAGAVALKIAPERQIQILPRLLPRDSRVLEIESILTVDV